MPFCGCGARLARGLGRQAIRLNRLIVDLANVTLLDSSGLAVLVNGMQNTQEYGGEFLLAAMQENLRPIFEIACLDQVFKVLPDADYALAATS